MGILLEPANAGQPLKVVLTGPKSTADYFVRIKAFIQATLGDKAADMLHVIVDDPAEVARYMVATMEQVRDFRRNNNDSYNYNWLAEDSRRRSSIPFEVTHESMRSAAPVPRPAGARTGGGSAPRVLRHRDGQREGKRRPRDREARPYELTGDAVGDETARRTARGVRGAEANEASGQRATRLATARRAESTTIRTITSCIVKSTARVSRVGRT